MNDWLSDERLVDDLEHELLLHGTAIAHVCEDGAAGIVDMVTMSCRECGLQIEVGE